MYLCRLSSAAIATPLALAVALLLASCSSFGGEPASRERDAGPDGQGAVDATPDVPDVPPGSDAPKRVYVVGGHGYTPFAALVTNEVRSAPIGPDGSLGTWRAEAELPDRRTAHTVVAVGRTLLVISGGDGVNYEGTFFAATAGADGVLGGWQDVTTISPVGEAAAASDGHFIHLLGGERFPTPYAASVFVTQLGGAPKLTSTTALIAGRRRFAAVRVGDQLVAIGGEAATPEAKTDSVYSARVLGDGSLEPWATSAPLPAPLSQHAAVSVDDNVYVLGGQTNALTSQVLRATRDPNGLGAWTQATPLPSARAQHCAATVGGFVYALGGILTSKNDAGTDPVATDESLVSKVAADGSLGPWKATSKASQRFYGARCAAF